MTATPVFLADNTMSKPISISFGKSSSSASAEKRVAPAPKPSPFQNGAAKKAALHHDSDDEEELKHPVHESVTGFSSDGIILGTPVQEKNELVIKNLGNGDWRKRRRGGKNILPSEAQQQGADVFVVEKDEVSKASGLQFAVKGTSTVAETLQENGATTESTLQIRESAKEQTEDEIALKALLNDGEGPKSTSVIEQKANANLTRPDPVDETGDFRADVASRPDSATLDDYAAMPVEEFGLAMLRGMGQKRRANGEIIKYGDANGSTVPKAREPRQGYLGIGAKASPGAEVELGAWGKAAMRKSKNSKNGEGLYTPVMLRDKRTGEMLTEEQLLARKREAKERLNGKVDDWRVRRDRNLERSGRDSPHEQKRLTDKDDYRDQMNSFSRDNASHRDERNGSSHRDRSRSRDRRRRDDNDRDDKHRDRDRDKDRERRHDKYRDDDRYESSSSRKSSHRDRERNGHDKDDDRRRRDRY